MSDLQNNDYIKTIKKLKAEYECKQYAIELYDLLEKHFAEREIKAGSCLGYTAVLIALAKYG